MIEKAVQRGKAEPSANQGGQAARVLQATVVGEYLSMLFIVHAGFGAAAWMHGAKFTLLSLGIISVSMWIITHCAGVYTGSWISVFVTLFSGYVVFTVGRSDLSGSPRWLSQGPFSPMIFLIVIGVVLIIDLIDVRWNRGGKFL